MNPSPNIEPVKAMTFHCVFDEDNEYIGSSNNGAVALSVALRHKNCRVVEGLWTPIASESKSVECLYCSGKGWFMSDHGLGGANERVNCICRASSESKEAVKRDASVSEFYEYDRMKAQLAHKEAELKEYEERELHHHRKIEEQRKEVDRLNGEMEIKLTVLQDEYEGKCEEITQLTKKLERYEKDLKCIRDNYDHEDSTRGIVRDDQDHNRCHCRCCIATEALSPQPIEPTVAESARVNVSAEEALNWLDRNLYSLKNSVQDYFVSDGWNIIGRGRYPIDALRDAMANEGNKEI